MAALLAVKSISLVRAAAPQGAAAQMPAHEGTGAAHTAAAAAAPPTAGSAPPDAAMKAADKGAPSQLPPNPDAAAAAGSSSLDAPVSESERGLLLDLRQRRSELDAREAAMQTREQTLGAAERRLAARVDELTDLRKRLEALETSRKDRDEANWRSMVKVYEDMKPRDAAVIFNDLDSSVLLQVLDRMKESKAAPVLASMQPDRARRATVDLAQMRIKANATASMTKSDKADGGAADPLSTGK